MKRFFLLILTGFAMNALFAQSSSCCSPAQTFASLGNNMEFVNLHPDPLPYTLEDMAGHMITFMASDGKEANAYFIEAKQKTNNYIIVFHEWWGLNDYIKTMADKLYQEVGNVNVIAIDLYDGKIAATKEEAQQYMQELQEARVMAMIDGIRLKTGPDARVATVGWCMGGGWSLQASIRMQKEAVACVMYYGYPEKDSAKISALQAPVLFVLANQDKFVTPEVVNAFGRDMKAKGKQIEILSYDANHGFANPSNPKHDATATADAYTHTLAFLRKAFP